MGASADETGEGRAARPAAAPITSTRVVAIAAPVALSNATVPLQGAIDTAIIGNLGRAAPLAAVGLGAEIFSLLFGAFNFLQIATSGLSAQALGRRDGPQVAQTLLRALALAGAIAALLLVAQTPLRWLGLALFEASAETEALAGVYFDRRIWGAPAELANYALVGWFAGQETTRRLFQHQVFLASANIALNLLFVVGFGWGVAGVALGTAIASWLGLGFGLWLARGRLAALIPPGWRPDRARLLDATELRRLMTLNRDVFIRTVLLIAAFAWTARLGSLQGDAMLAANVVLLQFFLISAYVLDGFAIAAETLVGQALGAGDPRALDRAAALSTVWAAALSAVAALGFALAAPAVIDLFTTAPEVRALAREHALWAALIPLAGVWAFQLDGIFVGATGGAAMRDSMLITSAFFFPGSLWALEAYGNHGVWAALWVWLLVRALTLLAYYPRLRRRAAQARPPGDA